MRLLLPEARPVTDEDLPDLYDVPGPCLRGGLVVALDGSVTVDGASQPLSGEADKAVFRALRTVADAVLIGAGTARSEDYQPVRHRPAAQAWRAAHDRSPQAPLVVVSHSGRLDPASRLFAGTGPVLVAVPETADVPDLPNAEVLRVAGGAAALLAALQDRGLHRLLCEGGPQLLTAFAQAGLLDELCLTTSPAAVGDGPHLLAGPLQVPTRFALASLLYDEPGFLLARWTVVRDEAGAESPR